MKDDPKPDPEAAFYDHLDACAQCRQHPFDLCAEGARLLKEGARSLLPPLDPEVAP